MIEARRKSLRTFAKIFLMCQAALALWQKDERAEKQSKTC